MQIYYWLIFFNLLNLFLLWKRNRGYYTVVRRYEFYVQVARTMRSLVRYCSCHENIKFISSS